MKKYIQFAIFSIFILSLSFVFKRCNLKGGSVIVNAKILEIKNCPKMDLCFHYVYNFNGQQYNGEESAFKGPVVGSNILVEISVENPSISYIKR